jgi:hypothetical protein
LHSFITTTGITETRGTTSKVRREWKDPDFVMEREEEQNIEEMVKEFIGVFMLWFLSFIVISFLNYGS